MKDLNLDKDSNNTEESIVGFPFCVLLNALKIETMNIEYARTIVLQCSCPLKFMDCIEVNWLVLTEREKSRQEWVSSSVLP